MSEIQLCLMFLLIAYISFDVSYSIREARKYRQLEKDRKWLMKLTESSYEGFDFETLREAIQRHVRLVNERSKK